MTDVNQEAAPPEPAPAPGRGYKASARCRDCGRRLWIAYRRIDCRSCGTSVEARRR